VIKINDLGSIRVEIDAERTNSPFLMHQKSFRIAIISSFTALSVVLGYALAYLPNIEIFTLFIFLSGFVLGRKEGLIVGLLSSFIFTFFNPLGPSPLPLLGYQIFHYSLTGFLGGIIRNYLNHKAYFKPKEDLYKVRIIIIFGIVGALLTFIYDVLSTLIGALMISLSFEFFITQYLIGIIFTTIHLVGNTLGFVFILPGLSQIIVKIVE
jgi:uncharacterized membrane protein